MLMVLATEAKMPKEISLSINKHRGKWTINAMPIGGKQRVGRFEKWNDAKAEAILMASRHNLGIVERSNSEKITGEFAIQQFSNKNDSRVAGGEIAAESKKNIDRVIKDYIEPLRIDGVAFGKLDLKAVFRSDVKDDLELLIVNHLKATGKKPNSIKSYFGHAKHLLAYCKSRGWIECNPLERAKLVIDHEEVEDKVAPIVQPGVVKAVLAELDKESLTHRAMVWLSAETGIRQGEARALKWKDVDIDRGVIHVVGAVKAGTLFIGGPKTKNGRRKIAYGSTFSKLVRELYMAASDKSDDALVFPTRTGKPKSKKTLQALAKRIGKRAGVPDWRWGLFRHAFASMQLNGSGKDFRKVSEAMGHHSSEFTEKQYGHTIDIDEKHEATRAVTDSFLQ